MFQTEVTEKIATHLLCSITFFVLPENSAVCEIMWRSILEPNRPPMTIWCTRIACRMPKATDRHSEYATLVAFLLQQWLRERAPLTFFVHCMSCSWLQASAAKILDPWRWDRYVVPKRR